MESAARDTSPDRGQGPLILYVAREKPVLGRAPVLQILHTLNGLRLAGALVRLVTPWSRRRFDRAYRELLGTELPSGLEVECLGPGPDLPLVGRFWPAIVNRGFEARLARYLRRVARTSDDAVVYTRNRRWVAHLAGEEHPPIVLEYHEPRSRVLEEERGADDPQVAEVRGEERAALAHAVALVTVSRLHAQDAPELYGYRGPIHVIPNGADPAIFGLSSEERRPVPGRFLYVGSLAPWKGLDVALRALAGVSGAELHVCGGQPGTAAWHALIKMAAELGVRDRLVLHGTLPQHELRPLVAQALAGILPLDGRFSLAARYTSPLKIFEYLCAGLPVLAGDLPSVRDLVSHGRDGLLFAERDAQGLARAMRQLIEDPGLAAHLSHQARQAGARCTWQCRGERVKEVCRAVHAARTSGASTQLCWVTRNTAEHVSAPAARIT